MHSPAITARIEAADLPATTYRTARRLLDLASEDGHVTLTKDTMLDLCGTDKWNTVRAHLGQLTRAGIIHYSTNSMVYVNFVIAERSNLTSERSSVTSERSHPTPPMIAERAQMTSERSQDAPVIAERSFVTSERAQMTSERSNEPSNTGWLVGWTNDQDPDTNQPTTDDPPDAGDIDRSIALLTDPEIGLSVDAARQRAQEQPFASILRVVAGYWTDFQDGKVSSPGVLNHRLRSGWSAGPISAEFRRSPLCERHSPEETADPTRRDSAQNRQRYRPDGYEGYTDYTLH